MLSIFAEFLEIERCKKWLYFVLENQGFLKCASVLLFSSINYLLTARVNAFSSPGFIFFIPSNVVCKKKKIKCNLWLQQHCCLSTRYDNRNRYIRNLTHLCNAPVIIIIALNLEKLIVANNRFLLLQLFSRYKKLYDFIFQFFVWLIISMIILLSLDVNFTSYVMDDKADVYWFMGFVFFFLSRRQLRDGSLDDNQLMQGSRLTLLPSVETGLLVSTE
jgi:hypothetical protein